MKYKILYTICIFIFLSLFFYSCKKENILFKEDFTTNSNRWDTLHTTYISNKIGNGEFILDNKLNNIINFSLIKSSFLNKNISFTSTLKLDHFYGENGIGGIILFADDQQNPKNYIFFGVNNQNEISISKENINSTLSQTYYKQKNKFYKTGKPNDFSLIISKDNIHFQLNKESILTIKSPNHYGTFYGFVVLDSKMTVSNLIVKSTD